MPVKSAVSRGVNPYQLDSTQEVTWKSDLQSEIKLVSVYSKACPWAGLHPAGPGNIHPLLAARWYVQDYHIEDNIVGILLLLGAAYTAQKHGSGLVMVFQDANKAEDPMFGAFMREVNQGRMTLDFKQVIAPVMGKPPMDLAGITVDLSRYNSARVREIAKDLDREIMQAGNVGEQDRIMWKDLPPVWQRWLSAGRYRLLREGTFGMFVRHDNGLRQDEVASAGWRPDPKRFKVQRKLANTLVLEQTMKMGDIRFNQDMMKGDLTKYVCKVFGYDQNNPDLIEASSRKQGDFDPSGGNTPHLLFFLHAMFSKLDPRELGKEFR